MKNIMKKENTKLQGHALRPDYNFCSMLGGVRRKCSARYKAGTNLIHLDPDVAKVFKDGESVNTALRSLTEIAKKQVGKGV